MYPWQAPLSGCEGDGRLIGRWTYSSGSREGQHLAGQMKSSAFVHFGAAIAGLQTQSPWNKRQASVLRPMRELVRVVIQWKPQGFSRSTMAGSDWTCGLIGRRLVQRILDQDGVAVCWWSSHLARFRRSLARGRISNNVWQTQGVSSYRSDPGLAHYCAVGRVSKCVRLLPCGGGQGGIERTNNGKSLLTREWQAEKTAGRRTSTDCRVGLRMNGREMTR